MAAIVLNKTAFLNAPITMESLHGVTFSNESKGHKFVISCMQDGELINLTGSVSARFMRANGTTILLASGEYGDIVDGKAVVTLHQDCYNVPGRFQLSIFNTVGQQTTCIYACVGTVQRTQNEELIDSGDVVPDISELLAQIEACEDATDAANTAAAAANAAAVAGDNKFVRYDAAQTLTDAQKNTARTNTNSALADSVAPLFDATQVYNAGSYVRYTDGNLYKITARHNANVTWANTQKTLANVGSALVQTLNDAGSVAQMFAEGTRAYIAPNFSNTAAYSAGDYVIYNAQMWRFNTDHAAGDWNVSEVTAVVVGSEVSGLKSALDGIDNVLWTGGKHEVIVSRIDKAFESRNNYIQLNSALDTSAQYDIQIDFSDSPLHLSAIWLSTSASGSGAKENILSQLTLLGNTLKGTFSTTYSNILYINIQFDSAYSNDLTANISIVNHAVAPSVLDAMDADIESNSSQIADIKTKFDKLVEDKNVTISGRTSYFAIGGLEEETAYPLIANQKYHITLTFDTLPSVSAIYTHSSKTSGSVIDTITNLFATHDNVMECDYTPTADNVKYIRIVLTASPDSDIALNVETVAVNYGNPVGSQDDINRHSADIANITQLTYQKCRMKFGAHQGSRLKAPQNSIPAYTIAGQDGWDYLWLAGCRCTTDHVWYVMHDNDVSTTTDGNGNLSDMTSVQVNALRINSGANVDKYTSDELIVPTVEKAIQIANRYGMGICFRIGNLPTTYDTEENRAIWDSFVGLIKSYSFEHGIFSGNVAQIQCIRNIVGENWEGCYFGTGQEDADTLISMFASLTNMSVILQYTSLTAEGVKKLHRNNIKVYAYSTAPTNAELLNASDMGVDIFQNAYAYKLVMP